MYYYPTSWWSYFPECFLSHPKFGLTFAHHGGLRVEIYRFEYVLLAMVGLHHVLHLPHQAYQFVKHHLSGRYLISS